MTDVCIEIIITTREFASEISWSFETFCNSTQQYQDNQEYNHTCCYRTNSAWQYKLRCQDANGDGWHGAFITVNDRRYCDQFSEGHETTALIEANPSKH